MGVIGKKRDQGEEQGGKNRDPALTVKSQNHRSQAGAAGGPPEGEAQGVAEGLAVLEPICPSRDLGCGGGEAPDRGCSCSTCCRKRSACSRRDDAPSCTTIRSLA